MSRDAEPLAVLDGVSKSFGSGERTTLALDRIDLAVREGEFLSLLGPSGCGKTTVLRLIAGLDSPTSGHVSGRRLDSGEGGLSVVFQDPTLLPWASVEENVWLPLRLAGMSLAQARDRIAPMLGLVGLASFAAAHPHELSGGMRMRAALARALVTRPRLLLMDEPFAALDEITRLRLNDDLLRIVRETRCTVIFVTHAIYESVYLSTRLAVMSARPGRIVADMAVPLAPERGEATRRDAAYLDLCDRISGILRDEVVVP